MILMTRQWKRLLSILLAASLYVPTGVQAVTEDVVEEAPAVSISSVQPVVSYLPDASYYSDYGEWQPSWEYDETCVPSKATPEDGVYYDVEQRPRLTSGEKVRAVRLARQLAAGEISYEGESVLNLCENAVVSVLSLDPSSYDGEQLFFLLPGPCMSDDQLLAVIDACAKTGVAFDPDMFNERNCMRGGGIETTRSFTGEERERYTLLHALIRTGKFDYPDDLAESPVINVTLDARYYSGLEDFSVKPYRSMTDREMLALLQSIGVRNESGDTNFDAVERNARELLCGRFGCPLSMQLEYVFTKGAYVPMLIDADGNTGYSEESRAMYGASFLYQEGDGTSWAAMACYDRETGEVLQAVVTLTYRPQYATDGFSSATSIEALLQEAGQRFGMEDAKWTLSDHVIYVNGTECISATAPYQDGLYLTVRIGAHQIEQVLLERMTPVDELPPEQFPQNG